MHLHGACPVHPYAPTPRPNTRLRNRSVRIASDDDGAESRTSLSLAYPEHLERWAPLYKWALAIPQYFVLAALFVLGFLGILAGFFAELFTGEYPESIRGLLVGAYRYSLRLEAYVGFLTDRYPPFSLAA